MKQYYTFESELPRIAYLLPSYIVKLTVPHLDIEGLMQYFIFGFTEQSPMLGSILLELGARHPPLRILWPHQGQVDNRHKFRYPFPSAF
ncbi:hypothetical protein PVAP13_7KG256810 [Panicum virgatum]|uniref:Uncharacterized protein n=1 Tax=Panicum virgatum TaxID=38727 RepID=A0A8T0QJS8_PANVG|nr:hypothetical protein PVAP13_7KG256810 [Panicum virgatum]